MDAAWSLLTNEQRVFLDSDRVYYSRIGSQVQIRQDSYEKDVVPYCAS
jgi:hypothetical protein